MEDGEWLSSESRETKKKAASRATLLYYLIEWKAGQFMPQATL